MLQSDAAEFWELYLGNGAGWRQNPTGSRCDPANNRSLLKVWGRDSLLLPEALEPKSACPPLDPAGPFAIAVLEPGFRYHWYNLRLASISIFGASSSVDQLRGRPDAEGG
jgi:hypothetical protein